MAVGEVALAEPGLSAVVDVAMGSCHTCVVMACEAQAPNSSFSSSWSSTGHAEVGQTQVKCWGCNSHGQLGSGSVANLPQRPPAPWTASRRRAGGVAGGVSPDAWLAAVPTTRMLRGVHVRAVSAGDWHTCALDFGGEVRCWGDNSYGIAGLGYATPDLGRAGDDVEKTLAPVPLGKGANVVQLAASSHGHACALLASGGLKCWGHNAWGQLGYGDMEHRGDWPGEMGDRLPPVELASSASGSDGAVAHVSTGGYHTCTVLERSGHVKCWGANGWGELGYGDVESRGDEPREMGVLLPAVTLGASSAVDHAEGEGEVAGLETRAVAVAAGKHFSCALLAGPSGKGDDSPGIKCWGANVWGQLGYGDLAQRGHAPGTMGSHLPLVPLPGTPRSLEASGDGYFACAVVDHERRAPQMPPSDLHCWPFPPPEGELFEDPATEGEKHQPIAKHHVSLPKPTALQSPLTAGEAPRLHAGSRGVNKVALGAHGACAILSGGGVKCFGLNEGQLGYGGKDDHLGLTANAVPSDVDVGSCDRELLDFADDDEHPSLLRLHAGGSDAGRWASTPWGASVPLVLLGGFLIVGISVARRLWLPRWRAGTGGGRPGHPSVAAELL